MDAHQDYVPQKAEIPCLQCGQNFTSPDRRRVRRCGQCKKTDYRLSMRELGLEADRSMHVGLVIKSLNIGLED